MFDILFWFDPVVGQVLAREHMAEARAIVERSIDGKREHSNEGRDAGPKPPSNRLWTDAASLPPVSAP